MRITPTVKSLTIRADVADGEPLTVTDQYGQPMTLTPTWIEAQWFWGRPYGNADHWQFNNITVHGHDEERRTNSAAWYRDDLAEYARERMDTAPAWVRSFAEESAPEGGD